MVLEVVEAVVRLERWCGEVVCGDGSRDIGRVRLGVVDRCAFEITARVRVVCKLMVEVVVVEVVVVVYLEVEEVVRV